MEISRCCQYFPKTQKSPVKCFFEDTKTGGMDIFQDHIEFPKLFFFGICLAASKSNKCNILSFISWKKWQNFTFIWFARCQACLKKKTILEIQYDPDIIWSFQLFFLSSKKTFLQVISVFLENNDKILRFPFWDQIFYQCLTESIFMLKKRVLGSAAQTQPRNMRSQGKKNRICFEMFERAMNCL